MDCKKFVILWVCVIFAIFSIGCSNNETQNIVDEEMEEFEGNTILDYYNEDLTVVTDPEPALDLTYKFRDNLELCIPSRGTFALGLETMMGIFRGFEIVGEEGGFCEVDFWFLNTKRTPKVVLNKKMTCKYGVDERSLQAVNNVQDFCTGPLVEALNNIKSK